MSLSFRQVSEFCKTGSGSTPSRKKAEVYYGGAIPWVKSGELKESVLTSTSETVTEQALAETSIKMIPKDALLVAMYGATVGRVGILGIEATSNQAVCHIIPDPKVADTRYMFHALQAKSQEFIGRGVGGAQPNISQGTIKGTKVFLPPLAEQKRIAGILDQADALRRQRQRALDHLNQLGQSIFYEMFGNPLSNDTDLEKVPFGEVVRIINGRAYRKHEERETGTPVIRIQNLNGGERYFYSDMDLPADKYCDEGDLLFAWSATFGPYIWYGGKSIYHYHIWKLECSDRINKEYCFWFLKAISKNVKDRGNGISMTHATKGGMEARPIPLPAIDHQNQFSKVMLVVDSKIKKYESLLRKSEILFTSLQQRAFRGEL